MLGLVSRPHPIFVLGFVFFSYATKKQTKRGGGPETRVYNARIDEMSTKTMIYFCSLCKTFLGTNDSVQLYQMLS